MIVNMRKSKIILGVFLVFTTLIMVTSCSKDDQKSNENQKNQFSELRTNSKYDNYSIFGNNHLVPMSVAQTIAQKINMAVPVELRNGTGLRTIESSSTITDSLGNAYIYVFNYQGGGYVMISADERHEPIVSLVGKGLYQQEDVPSGLYNWLIFTLESIDGLKSGTLNNSRPAKQQWIEIVKNIDEPALFPSDNCCPECPNYPECKQIPSLGCGEPDIRCFDEDDNGDPCGNTVTVTKGPYLTTEWDQDCGYNDQCPDKDCDICFSHERAYTGCVATAMCQILKYWAHPSSQSYNYASMPNLSANSEVARIMKDAGTAVDMDYGCEGSGADQDNIAGAFKNDFSYSTSTLNNYGSGAFSTVMSDLDQSKPVILVGYRTKKKHKFIINWWTSYENGHAWDCDGYTKTSNNCYSTIQFHMNWGWGGTHNGWYNNNTWNPGSYNYQYARQFVHNIHP
jgi:hypothetical protein